jgi:hypothetical protein
MMLAAMLLAAVAPAMVTVDAALLSGLPIAEVTLTVHGETHVCSGPTLANVVGKMGAPQGKDIKADALTTSILAKGRDGYSVRFSLGEIDPKLGASKAIVASSCDGKPLGETDGPYRLVVPGEQRAARSVRQLESLTIQP